MTKRSRLSKGFFLKFLVAVVVVVVCSLIITHQNDNLNADPSPETSDSSTKHDEKIAELISHMSLEDKIRQMFIVEMRDYENDFSPYEFFSTYHYGGIIMFGENVESVEQITRLNSDLQKVNAAAGGLPLFIAIDQEGGYIDRAPTTLFPGNMAIAATGNYEHALTAGRDIGDELSAMGFNVDFAPDADVNTNPDNPIIGIRSFGDDPGKVADFAVAFAEGLGRGGVISCAKHFPGHGDTATDSHTSLPIIERSMEELDSTELVPFQSLVQHDVDMVMTAHIVVPSIEKDTFTTSDGVTVSLPATLSDDVIDGLLRRKLNYDGVVITDSLQMSAIQDNFAPRETAKLAINAGVDILLIPYNINSKDAVGAQERLVYDIAAMVNGGEISASRIDESVKRILRLKIDKGLLEDDYANPNLNHTLFTAVSTVRAPSHLAEESSIAEDAVTIYRGADLLPQRQDQRLLVVPVNHYQAEIITHTFASTNIDANVMSLDDNDYTAITEAIENADLLILTSRDMGGDDTETTEAINTLIARAKEQGISSIVISTGLPYDVVEYQDADIVMAVYNPGIGFIGGPYPENIPAALRVIFGASTSPSAGGGSFPVKVE